MAPTRPNHRSSHAPGGDTTSRARNTHNSSNRGYIPTQLFPNLPRPSGSLPTAARVNPPLARLFPNLRLDRNTNGLSARGVETTSRARSTNNTARRGNVPNRIVPNRPSRTFPNLRGNIPTGTVPSPSRRIFPSFRRDRDSFRPVAGRDNLHGTQEEVKSLSSSSENENMEEVIEEDKQKEEEEDETMQEQESEENIDEEGTSYEPEHTAEHTRASTPSPRSRRSVRTPRTRDARGRFVGTSRTVYYLRGTFEEILASSRPVGTGVDARRRLITRWIDNTVELRGENSPVPEMEEEVIMSVEENVSAMVGIKADSDDETSEKADEYESEAKPETEVRVETEVESEVETEIEVKANVETEAETEVKNKQEADVEESEAEDEESEAEYEQAETNVDEEMTEADPEFAEGEPDEAEVRLTSIEKIDTRDASEDETESGSEFSIEEMELDEPFTVKGNEWREDDDKEDGCYEGYEGVQWDDDEYDDDTDDDDESDDDDEDETEDENDIKHHTNNVKKV
ncbi:hypothetical protein M501DRAFT_995048 [Patellaria atrata CBS 101060]|uniref:Uncharacterized protein n=1 Tax=Patellaria atrata CBS 101060 TaxID=1346257 RepID=A0A9P4VQH2_9PEZI|nr:hypothetical protein M501DRAFT_995048 [Patellaria atrata CBS 101060]